MRLTISGHHVDVTDGLRERISKKLRRLERHCESIDHIEFVLVVERAVLVEGVLREGVNAAARNATSDIIIVRRVLAAFESELIPVGAYLGCSCVHEQKEPFGPN